MQHPKWLASSLLLLAAAASTACPEKLDTTRTSVDNGSFGTTVYTIACQRIAYERDLADGDGKVDVSGATYRATCRQGDAPWAGAPAEIEALHAQRAPLIEALDVMFPADYLSELQKYLTTNAFLSMYDDGTMERSITSLVDVLDLAADDPQLAGALANLDRRPGYRPSLPALGVVRAVAGYDDLSTLVKELTDAIAEGGPAHTEFVKLQLALSKELADSAPAADAGAKDRTLRLATNLLLTESPLLGNGVPRPLVLRDQRGLAIVEKDPATNRVAAPFVDVDNDGLADVDNDGNFVDAAGLAISVPAPFATPYAVPDLAVARDASKRALQSANGPTLYQYVDLDHTVLAALVRDVPQLFDPLRGTALDFLRGSSALLGPRMPGTVHTYSDGSTISYLGYDQSNSPLLDIVYGVLTLVGDPNLKDTLAFAKTLMQDHEPEAARLLESIWQVADFGDQFPNAKLEAKSAMFDDLMPILLDDPTRPAGKLHGILTEPGLVEDLLVAMQDPKVRDLGDRFRDYMKYKDRFDIDSSGPPWALVGSFSTEVDRNQADSAYNRSLFERLLHLIHDSRGVTLCNKDGAAVGLGSLDLAFYDECKLFKIDDLAIFYVQSIARARPFSTDGGNLGNHPTPKALLDFHFNDCRPSLGCGTIQISGGILTDDFIEDQATIDGFRRHPTPAALNRVLFIDPAKAPQLIQKTTNPPKDRDGDLFFAQHAGNLPVWEKNGFYDQIQPIVQVFADHGREDLFVDAMVVMHQHWPSKLSTDTQSVNPGQHGFAKQSNAQSFEPLIVKVLEEGDFWHALVDGSPVLNNITVGSKKGFQILADAGRYIFKPQNGLSNRLGVATTKTEDGRDVPVLSPWYVLADAYKGKRAAVAASASEGAAWEKSTSDMVDIFLRGEDTGGGTWRFQNPRLRGVSLALIDFLNARIAAHSTDLIAWSRTELPNRLRDILTGPVFAGAADLVLSLVGQPEARKAIEKLNAYLCTEAASSDAFVTALTGAGDLMQLLLDDKNLVPILKFAGQVMHPDFGKDRHPDFSLMDAQLEFLRKARAADETSALAKLLGYSFAEIDGRDRTPVGQLVDSIFDVQRVDPVGQAGQPLTVEDYAATFHAVSTFLNEEKRGFLRFVTIVKERNVRD